MLEWILRIYASPILPFLVPMIEFTTDNLSTIAPVTVFVDGLRAGHVSYALIGHGLHLRQRWRRSRKVTIR